MRHSSFPHPASGRPLDRDATRLLAGHPPEDGHRRPSTRSSSFRRTGTRSGRNAHTQKRPGPCRPSKATGWFDRWLAACQDLAELERSHPMTDAVIDEIDGRMIRIGDHWLADFASCNYLGFDLDREIIDVDPRVPRRAGELTRAGRGCSAAPCSTGRSRSS